MTESEAFGLYPKRHIHVCNWVRIVFRALFLDALEDRFDIMTDKLADVFRSGDPRLDGIQLVPVQPTTTTSLENIDSAAWA